MTNANQAKRANHAKRERVIEAVRRGLEGDAAIEFLHQSGYAMTSSGIARHLRKLGGRGRVLELVEAGKSNAEILAEAEDDEPHHPAPPPATQSEHPPVRPSEADLFPTKKMTIQMPSDLYEAIRLAAKAEKKNQNQLIVDILTAALSRMSAPLLEDNST